MNKFILKKYILLSSFLLCLNHSFAQDYYTMRGYVYSEKNEPLAAANVRVFNLNTGTITKENGQYEIRLIEGLNRISVTSVGYVPETFEVVAEKDFIRNVFLKIDQKQLDEVVVKVKRRDESYEVIKQVLENKGQLLNQFQHFKSEIYIKAIENIESKAPKVGSKADSLAKLDTIPKMNLFECKLTRHETALGLQKEEKLAVKKIGDQPSLFYKSVTDGEFNLYKNHQKIKKIGDNEYTSPLSDLTFLSYKFQLKKSFFEGNQKIYQIKVTPRDLGNALYEGDIEVLDGLWVLRSAKLELSKRGLLNYDSFGFEQYFENVSGRWMPTKTTYHWSIKENGKKRKGETVVIQQNFEFDFPLPKRFFGDEVGRTDDLAYKRDSSFWESIRPQPLSANERLVIKEKERIDILKSSKAYLDSVDKKFNKITFAKVLYLGVGHINRFKKTNWSFDPVVTLVDPLAIGGWRARYGVAYYRKFENKQEVSVNTNVTYGFSNNDPKGGLNITYRYNPIRQSRVSVQGGSVFGVINGFATFRDVALRSNFYQRDFVELGHRTEIINGLYINSSGYYEQRRDLSKFKFASFGDRLFENNKPSVFPTGDVYKTSFSLDYTPRQLFLREPDQKIILGSRFPTFNAQLSKAWGLGQRAVSRFSYVSVGMRQTFNVNVLGTSEYRINAGKFLDTSRLAPMDYVYMRGGDDSFFSPAMFTYQLIPQTFTVFDWFFESHYQHQFNGFFTSKIPLLNKTGIKEMAGGGFLYVPERNYQYAELFLGANKIVKILGGRWRLGLNYVVAQSNQFGVRNGVKFSIDVYNPLSNTWNF